MRVDLEEKIRKLEEDRHNSDISAGNGTVHVLSFSAFKHFFFNGNAIVLTTTN